MPRGCARTFVEVTGPGVGCIRQDGATNGGGRLKHLPICRAESAELLLISLVPVNICYLEC